MRDDIPQGMPVRVADIRHGMDAVFDAWLYGLLIDNNLAYRMNPDIIASPEQLDFIVQRRQKEQIYLPCSDATFALLCEGGAGLRAQQGRVWRVVMRLVREVAPSRALRQRLIAFCRNRFRHYLRQDTLLPTRLMKRMTNLVLAQGEWGDLWRDRRRAANARQNALLESPDVRRRLDAMPERLPADMPSARREMRLRELARLLCLSAFSRAINEQGLPPDDAFSRVLAQAEERLCALQEVMPLEAGERVVLLICDADGGIVFDLAATRCLVSMGFKVIVALKEDFYFYAPTLDDVEDDPVLARWCKKAHVERNPRLSKNDLVRLLRENDVLFISDGTRERLNFYRTSITFARAWKEADLILSKGWRNADMLLGTSHEFTRDIFCFWHDEEGFQARFRPRAAEAHKFSAQDIADLADVVITRMRQAHAEGRTVMFYSCIIGSIPGQTATAVALVRAFLESLRASMDNVFIVNPTEYFIEGMDGDDLMFMWERVQRSGYIDIWRFQTVDDIERSFALLGRKVPPEWLGKDATYSTGCTKEMRIAQDVQLANREMQIIGPAPSLFRRRSEYGVGKYFDASIVRR